jgi:hypothetical protein
LPNTLTLNTLIVCVMSVIRTTSNFKSLSLTLRTQYLHQNDSTHFLTDVNRLPHILYILLIKSILFVCIQGTLAELGSDHIPVKITINLSSQSYQADDSIINGKPNWDMFSNCANANWILPKTIPRILVALIV